jgi:hypothetical protein
VALHTNNTTSITSLSFGSMTGTFATRVRTSGKDWRSVPIATSSNCPRARRIDAAPDSTTVISSEPPDADPLAVGPLLSAMLQVNRHAALLGFRIADFQQF